MRMPAGGSSSHSRRRVNDEGGVRTGMCTTDGELSAKPR